MNLSVRPTRVVQRARAHTLLADPAHATQAGPRQRESPREALLRPAPRILPKLHRSPITIPITHSYSRLTLWNSKNFPAHTPSDPARGSAAAWRSYAGHQRSTPVHQSGRHSSRVPLPTPSSDVRLWDELEMATAAHGQPQ